MMLDVVYLLGPGDAEPLRYSLRSLRNVPHGAVWVAGAALPKWVQGVKHIPVGRVANRYRSTTANLRAACEESALSEEFLLFNDDFFVMRPVEHVPPMHRGPTADVVRRLAWADGRYMSAMRHTMTACRQFAEVPLCYEVHAPMPMVKADVRRMLASREFIGHDAHKRSLYANMFAIGGGRIPRDPKVVSARGGFDPTATYLSVGRWGDTQVIRHIKAAFPEPCEYERR